MAFTVTDFADLVRLLDKRPEWQAELRRLILSEDFLALPRIVQELAEAQKRTEQRVEELAQAQKRTEQRVEELAQAQKRTEAQMQVLTVRVEELAQAQKRTEQRVEELAQAQQRTEQRVDDLAQSYQGLATAVGQLQRAFGSTIEEEAESFVQTLLEEKGYRLLAEPYSLALDGEIDVVMELEAPTGERVWAVVEAKARLGHRQVSRWGRQIRSSGWQQRLAAQGVTGPYLVYAYGIRVDPGAVRAAEEQGIGLMTGRGERVPPKGLIG
jgi:uncharacterized protein YoxC